MNRRSFITAGTAVLALSSRRAFAIDVSALTGVQATSDLTGANVDLGDTGFEFHSRYIDGENDVEIMGFSNDTCDAAVRFMPSGTSTEEYLAYRSEVIERQTVEFEEIDSEVFDDGGWLAMYFTQTDTFERGSYMEVQLNAFERYDLEILFTSHLDTLGENFDLMQQVAVEGFEPFLFTQESGMPAIEFVAGSSSSTQSTRSNRSSRGTDTTDTTDQRGDTNTTETTGGDEDSVIEAVKDHQDQFMTEIDRFYEIIEMIASETEEDDSWFDEMLGFMDSWSEYPDTASDLVFPSSLSDLESVYIEWADGVGEMGRTMEEWIFNEGSIDVFLDAVDVAMQLNSALSAELRTLGVVIKPLGQGRYRPSRRRIQSMVKTRFASIS